ncbi:MAG TPA: efflux RND transporter periplasmic adaptor subunit, partial [Candidatus Limnocylindrales bacterium]|nr:efflux RND transporter periplasmic adaptor subunit [Candidatus Limnocylindrales bacterium]
PIDGYVTDRPLYPGEMASTSMPLLTVMDISRVLAKAHIPQSDAQLLRKGDKAGITVAGLEEKFEGTVVLISPALDPNSTTVEIWVQAANQEQQLRPGATVELSITAQTVHDALVVPASALLNASGDQAQVMVVDGQNVAQSRNVKTGIATPQEAQIVSGLKAGEIVVSEGAYGLPDNTRVQIAKANAASAEKGKAAPAEKDDKD